MCVHCEVRALIGSEKGLADFLGTSHGINKISVSRMVYFSCGDERFLVYQLNALCRSTLNRSMCYTSTGHYL